MQKLTEIAIIKNAYSRVIVRAVMTRMILYDNDLKMRTILRFRRRVRSIGYRMKMYKYHNLIRSGADLEAFIIRVCHRLCVFIIFKKKYIYTSTSLATFRHLKYEI